MIQPVRTVLLIFILAVLLPGCDIFQTRDPEPPTQGTSSQTPPDRPEIVLDNMRGAVAEANADNYIRTFSDSMFHFVPSAEVASRYASVFRDWGTDDERTYFRNLGAPQNGTPQLTFNNIQHSAVSSDSVLYTMDYTLYYPHRRPGVPQLVRGKMQLDLRPDSHRLWHVTTWRDFTSTSDSTWSYLKAVFSAN